MEARQIGSKDDEQSDDDESADQRSPFIALLESFLHWLAPAVAEMYTTEMKLPTTDSVQLEVTSDKAYEQIASFFDRFASSTIAGDVETVVTMTS